MRTKFLFLTFIILSTIEFSDCRRGGGGSKTHLSSTRIKTTPTVGSRYYRNRVFKCYSCDNTVDARLCAINPIVYAKKILCPKGELCSVERKELPAPAGFTKSDGVKTSGTKTSQLTSAPENMSSTQVSVWRGCKSPGSEILTDNSTTHFCAKDLCNHGDGHLKCFECSGTGINDKCMVNPSVSAKQVTCQPNEACYVERFAVENNSIAKTDPEDQWVSRGCMQSDVVDVTKYRSNDSVTVICRIGDFCNWMDALKIADSSSELRVSLTSVGLAFLFTLLL